MLLTPDRYAETTLDELLSEASLGRIGTDHGWIAAILARDPEETAQALTAFYMEMDEEVRIDLSAEIFHLLRALRSTAGRVSTACATNNAGTNTTVETIVHFTNGSAAKYAITRPSGVRS